MIGQINNGFSNLGKDNLIIYFLEGEKKNLNFGAIQKNSSCGLSTGGIVAIVISLLIFIGIVAGLIIFFFKKRKIKILQTENCEINNK